eukprot:4345448-Alexandrium_andersonii.AAC.1
MAVPEHGPGSGMIAPPREARKIDSRIQDPSGLRGGGSVAALVEIGVLDSAPLRQSSDFGDAEEGNGVAAGLRILKREPRPLGHGESRRLNRLEGE